MTDGVLRVPLTERESVRVDVLHHEPGVAATLEVLSEDLDTLNRVAGEANTPPWLVFQRAVHNMFVDYWGLRNGTGEAN